MYLNLHIRKGIVCVLCLVLVVLGGMFMVSGNDSAVATSAQPDKERINVPIIMYHSILKDPALQGEYVIDPNTFEADLKYITEHGFHTVVMADLIDYVYKGKDLPENPIMITFDDGYYNNYLYAFPLLKKYNCKMVLSPIGIYTDQYSKTIDVSAYYSNATWENLKEMALSGYVELQNHSYHLHKRSGARLGAKQKAGESDAEYKEILAADLKKAQERFQDELSITPNTFTYPFGVISSASLDVIKDLGFKATLTCEERINSLTKGNKECLYGLGRYLRGNQMTTEAFFAKFA